MKYSDETQLLSEIKNKIITQDFLFLWDMLIPTIIINFILKLFLTIFLTKIQHYGNLR